MRFIRDDKIRDPDVNSQANYKKYNNYYEHCTCVSNR